MTDKQRLAISPDKTVWMTASAGSGKTTVLTSRVVRLLLEGNLPRQILCITYTKAAAAEMLSRVRAILATWVTLPNEALQVRLEDMLGQAPTPLQVQKARSLFAQVLEAPEGLRVHTIHGFCQSILQRFPLEAGVPVHFEVLEPASAKEILQEVKRATLNGQLHALEHDAALSRLYKAAIEGLLEVEGEQRFEKVLDRIIAERAQFEAALVPYQGLDEVEIRFRELLNVGGGETLEKLHEEFNQFYTPDIMLQLAAIIDLLKTSGANDQKSAQRLEVFQKYPDFEHFVGAFTKGDEKGVYAPNYVMTGGLGKKHPDKMEWLYRLLSKAESWFYRYNLWQTARSSAGLLVLSKVMLEEYRWRKSQRHALDYDDLVFETHRLFASSQSAEWIRYKLDGGIRHILLDEAQDTSPQQWDLLLNIAQEFYAGEGQHKKPRTMFVVGDTKQSIYSFQGARPDVVHEKKRQLKAMVEGCGQAFLPLVMDTSFRSASQVLKAVDAVFNAGEYPQKGALLAEDENAMQHFSSRQGAAGKVVLWPLVIPSKSSYGEDPFAIPSYQAQTYGKDSFAQATAKTIAKWLREGRVLASTGRAIQAEDILILVRKRTHLPSALIQALKEHGVPVAGADRLTLLDSIAVQDMLALMQFLLLPSDDYSLACVLKSPLYGISEEALLALAHGRGGLTLWQRLQQVALEPEQAIWKEVKDSLDALLARVDFAPPQALLLYVLECQGGWTKMQARLGASCVDPLQELLRQAQDYSAKHVSSLIGFVQAMLGDGVDIKREMSEPNGEVRIMTMHTAKGLEAPVVIIADSTEDATATPDHAIWNWDIEHLLPLYAKKGGRELDEFKKLAEAEKEQRLLESCRLLYVAMTRAKDELYVAGIMPANRKNLPEHNFYSWIKSGLTHIATPVLFEAGEFEGEGYVLEAEQVGTQKPTMQTEEPKTPSALLPEWLYKPAPKEEQALEVWAPSSASQQSSHTLPLLSPSLQRQLYKRGRVVHQLLQTLPECPAEKREATGLRMMAYLAPEWGTEECQATLAEVLRIFAEPPFGLLFGDGSMAEVPLAGTIEHAGKQVRTPGQVDRMVVTDTQVWVVDYKTNQKVPESVEYVPKAYQEQLAAYAALLAQIYPHHEIHTALLYTAGPKWIELTPYLKQAA